MAKKSIKYNRRDNMAKIFGIISNQLVKHAPAYGMSVPEIIKAYKEDLENEDKEGYVKQIESVSVLGLSENFALKRKLIEYLDKMYKAEKSKEERDKKVEKTKKRQEENEEQKRQLVEKVWERVCEGANKYIISHEDKYLDTSDMQPKAWILVREKLDGILKKILGSDEVPSYLKKEIMQRTEDELYFQEVKYFTEDFKFLAGLPEAGRMSPYGRKFIKFDSNFYKTICNRYATLREALPLHREELAIRSILEDSSIETVTTRILRARLEYIDRKNYEEKYGNARSIIEARYNDAR